MRPGDTLHYSLEAVERAPLRTGLTLLAMAIGVAAVIVLTALGEGARHYVVNEFASLGTNLVIVLPGRSETTGGTIGASFGGTTRDLTIDDAAALTASYHVLRVAPIVVGAAGVAHDGLEREVPIFGGTSELLSIRHWALARGQFLPRGDWNKASQVCVIGRKIADELFGDGEPIGRWLRIGDRRFRVIGVLASEGRAMGIDTQELVVVPVASAMALFDTQSLFRILVEASERDTLTAAANFARETLKTRHHGEEDVTVITQDAILQTFDQIFTALTLTVAGIAAISLGVAGILIMNVMLVSVAQRASEIGLLKALGATSGQIVRLFLAEATLLSLLGALIGLVLGLTVAWAGSQWFPAMRLVPPAWAVGAAVTIAMVAGLTFGIAPARRAARLDPIVALGRH